MCQNLVVSKTKAPDESEKSVKVSCSDIRRNTEMLQEQELTSQVFLNCMIQVWNREKLYFKQNQNYILPIIYIYIV